ncbi:hypothetical protein [Pseudidiomarina insulisalsae]|uniref:Uncharacterized protein n=1 Tax=Pseudidiomarina insulisalsae TaxID=575789 RepID=A0A432YQJ5_9GAMM|nr:hypothetical protein [Pseudidiomarina insulisalsae]RUO63653.1 hypothetical protein CWI71_00890 [Pseudidiomarina insulisalsae]
MRYFNLSCVIVFLLQALPAQAQTEPVPWFDTVPRSDYYERVSTSNQAALEASFVALFRGGNDGLSEFYTIERLPWQEHEVVVAASHPELGWGAFGYRPTHPVSVFLQTPHRYFDLHTAVIAETGWTNDLVQLYMSNSIHRYAGQNQKPKVNSDISNARRSPLLAASEAWIAENPEGVIVQLHGYSKSKRSTVEGRNSDIILSHGTTEQFMHETRLHEIQTCLTALLNVTVLRYPAEVGELGGTQNNVAQALASWGKSEQFVHVEMSRGVRDALAGDQQTTLNALQCMVGASHE